jgi:hypothetical protein
MGDTDSIAALTKLVESLLTAQAQQNKEMQAVVEQLATKEATPSQDDGGFKFALQGITKLKEDGSNYKEWSGAIERMLQGHKSNLWGLECSETLPLDADTVLKLSFSSVNFMPSISSWLAWDQRSRSSTP